MTMTFTLPVWIVWGFWISLAILAFGLFFIIVAMVWWWGDIAYKCWKANKERKEICSS